MLAEPRTLTLTNCTFNWARLVDPADNPFGGPPNWELQIATLDENIAQFWETNFLNVKVKDEGWVVNLRRKTKTAAGKDMQPPRVVGPDAKKFPEPHLLGNGSKGNVMVWQASWERLGRKGVTTSLSAVQVLEFIKYEAEEITDFKPVTNAKVDLPEGFKDFLNDDIDM